MTDLIPTGAGAIAAREQLAQTRADLTRRTIEAQAAVDSARAELERQRAELEADFRRRQAELEATIAPLKAELAKVEEVAWTIDLYLGRDEQIELLVDGTPAPADTPITIRQSVLFADEESLVNVDAGGLDFRQMGVFLDWLTSDPARIDQLLPEPKGVIAVMPSRQHRDYGDSWFNNKADQANKQAHWLIRNGERLYLLVTDPELRVGDRIIPSQDEFLGYFSRLERGVRVSLEPGSAAWVKAEETADKRRRHFMRLMLVLQGILDRSVALHPLPTSGVSLLSMADQDSGKIVLLRELDNALVDGRPTFKQWRRDLMERLRPGMRVIVAASHPDFQDLRNTEKHQRWNGHRRITPETASHPPARPLVVRKRPDGRLSVAYPRTDKIDRKAWVPDPDRPGWGWNRWVEETPKTPASCWFRLDDEFVLPFDLASVADLEYYLSSRAGRRDYLGMVPVIRTALEAKRAETQAETPLREYLLARVLVEDPTGDETASGKLVDEAIAWWKTSTRTARALNGSPADEAKAVREILAEVAARRAATAQPFETSLIATARAAIPGVLAVVQARSGKYLAWAPTSEVDGPWLTAHTISKAGKVTSESPWRSRDDKILSTARTLWADKAWATHKVVDVKRHLTAPERADLVEQAKTVLLAKGIEPVVVTGSMTKNEAIAAFGFDPEVDLNDPGIDYRSIMTGVDVLWARRGKAITSTIDRWPARWDAYSQDHYPSSAPWDESERYADYGRPVRLWVDEVALARWTEIVTELKRRSRDKHEQALAAGNKAHRLQDAIRAAWIAHLTEIERARFAQDFGAQSDDIWEHHLGTLKLDKRKYPLNVRELDSMSRRIVNNGIEWDGKTLAELVAIDADLRTGEGLDVLDLGHLIASRPLKGA